MNEKARIENMLRRAEDRLGETRYAGGRQDFTGDAPEIPSGLESFGGRIPVRRAPEQKAEGIRGGGERS